MELPHAPDKYDRANEQKTREDLRIADNENFKRGRDVRLEQGERLVLRSPNGTQYSITVDNAGVIAATAF